MIATCCIGTAVGAFTAYWGTKAAPLFGLLGWLLLITSVYGMWWSSTRAWWGRS